ncbi:hypothetical protein BDDG_04022 [Blastomyces dermatitidis ATCC 18188]|uniref:Uncharacterized protein n=1 Tax=Ajellomyces dermatitidis (strain ATCC 18188 / CBS 674.68) TaxID=653446 RepID=F2TCX0_AJEDA|nr:hypothetical protein BDDG_04022 [Blastomyces dermatitidis ATCC 18188]
MMKVAIAGTSGLAQYIAHYISTQTYHQFTSFPDIATQASQRKAGKYWKLTTAIAVAFDMP